MKSLTTFPCCYALLVSAYFTFFLSIVGVAFGSGYYHLWPSNQTLFWDRLPIGVGFMGFFVGMLSDLVDQRLSRLLWPMVAIGIVSVVVWIVFEDLRLYAWVQFMPLLCLPFLATLFKSRFSHQWMLLVAFGWYAVAKVAEVFDHAVFELTLGLMSGHTLKHLLAAVGCFCILLMLKLRNRRGHAN